MTPQKQDLKWHEAYKFLELNIINNNPDDGVAPMMEEPQEQIQPQIAEPKSDAKDQALSISDSFKVITLSWLLSNGYTIAKLKANRSIKDKSVRAKMKSLRKYGQLIPATYVTGEEAAKQKLEIVNFFTNESCDDPCKTIVILDGQHRLEAHMRLLNEKVKDGEVKYDKEYFLMHTLNPEAAISCQLCEVNTITTPWDGTDFGHAAITMIDSEEDLPVLEFVAELTGKGCSLPAASCYATFTDKVSKRCLINAIDGKINDILKKSNNLQFGKSIRDAVENMFSPEFINGRTLPNWIASKWIDHEDDKKTFINNMVNFIASIKHPEANKIEKLKGSRGGDTKEALINKELNNLYETFMNTQSNE